MIIFSTEKYDFLKKNLLKRPKMIEGILVRKSFPDGERYLRIESDVLNQDVIVLGGTISDSDTLEIFDLCCALVKYGVKTLNIVIPYYGYSTMERTTKEREVVVAKTRARIFSAIPQASYGNKIFLLDLHSEGIPYYFEGDVKTVHLYAKDLILKMARDIAQGEEFVLGSTDAGRAKWVESLSHDLGCHAAFVYKTRLSGSETKVTGVNADVKQKHVIIYDDMIRTGGSLIQAAEAYIAAGATKISAITTHGIFPTVNGKSTVEKLEQSKLFYKIGVTNSHPRVMEKDCSSLIVEDLSDLFWKALIS